MNIYFLMRNCSSVFYSRITYYECRIHVLISVYFREEFH